jgi:hypothetical protein
MLDQDGIVPPRIQSPPTLVGDAHGQGLPQLCGDISDVYELAVAGA